jgi:hypothetical protein
MDAWMQKHRMTRWLGRFVATLLLVLFATANPAQAAVESVAPVADGGIWLFWDPNNWSPPTSSPDVACNSGYNAQWTPGNGYVYVGSVPNQYGYANLGYRDCIFTDRTGQIREVGSIRRQPFPPACPVPTVNPTVPYSYKVTSGMCEREAPCIAPNAVNPATGKCEPPNTCPVKALTAPPFNDACAGVLENINSTQAQKDAACGKLSQALKDGKACLEGKLAGMSPAIPLKVTSDIRSVAYQAHLREIWDKMELLVPLMEEDPTMQTACAARRAEIAAEKGCDNADVCTSCYAESATQRSHCLKGMPANPNPNDAQHTQGNAFDVSKNATINPLQAALGGHRPPETIPQFLDAPTNCNLIWGGAFKTNKDPVHFYAR